VQQDQLELRVQRDQSVQQAELLDPDHVDHKELAVLKALQVPKVFQLHVHRRLTAAAVMVNKMQNMELTWQ
jgi:hypothetical protein